MRESIFSIHILAIVKLGVTFCNLTTYSKLLPFTVSITFTLQYFFCSFLLFVVVFSWGDGVELDFTLFPFPPPLPEKGMVRKRKAVPQRPKGRRRKGRGDREGSLPPGRRCWPATRCDRMVWWRERTRI